jgi:hypothetical protein
MIDDPDIIVLATGNAIVLVFWWWVCFRGGDRKWSSQMKSFWFHRAYEWVQPKHCKMFAWAWLLAMITADIGVVVNKMIER